MVYRITNLKTYMEHCVETYDQAINLFALFFGQNFWIVRKDAETVWVDCGGMNEGFEIKRID